MTRRLTPEDLRFEGRSRITPEPVDKHGHWWVGSAEMLGVDRMHGSGITISCVAMATEIVRSLMNHLDAVLGDAWTEILMGREDWDTELAFSGKHDFVCLQSNTDAPPDEVARRAEPYLVALTPECR